MVANASHLVAGSASARFLATSPGGFSTEAVIGVVESMTLPGRCPSAPTMPDWIGLPSAPVSTVLTSGAGSPDSNDVLNPLASCADTAVAVATAGTESTIAPATADATSVSDQARGERMWRL